MSAPLTSAEFAEKVKRWITLDTQLKYVNEKTKQIRESRSALSKQISEYVHAKYGEHKPIALSEGELRFTEKRDYSPLTFAYIEECLDKLLTDSTQVDFILDYLRDHREIRTSTEIRRMTPSPHPAK